MPKGVMVVMSEPAAGQEDEYNDWYDKVHIPEMLEVPGIAAVQRFVAVPSPTGEVPAHQYLALYEFDTDVDEALSAMREARSKREPTRMVAPASSAIYTYRAAGDRVEAS